MKKAAEFLVDHRRVILAVMLAVTVLCGILATTVPINKDRTEYLADSSNMKQGLSVMESAFPEAEEKASIRVMFDGLTPEQITDVEAKLNALENVSSVTYDAESADHNKGDHTLFIVNSKFDYTSDEEKAIEAAIEREFSAYDMEYQNNDIQSTEVPLSLILPALALAITVLLIMSHSWLDPILFLATIGVAVIINMGTNIILPYTDELTAAVGPVLQLVLSMDYSIILMSRFRQEREKHSNIYDAMKTALAGSISPIASSSLTTAVGLLALVFLSFKLGPELGIVLAKGVFISMLCVFTLLPVMILGLDKWLEKTRKKAPHIPMGLFAKFSHKVRYAMPAIFAILLVGSFILQSFTAITFTEKSEDPLADVFPKDNTVVAIYNNKDEENVAKVIDELEKDERISSILGYANTLGKEMNADEMLDAINELSADSRIDEEIIRMLYFVAADGELPTLTAAEFMRFITDSIVPNETFSEYLNADILENVEYFEKFSDKETLTTPMTAGEMAAFFDINEESITQLYLYHTIQNGVADSGTMTVSAFVDFVLNTVAKDETYGTMFDADTLSALRQLQSFTDKETVQTGKTASALAEALGIEKDMVTTVFTLHNAGDISRKTMTVSEFSTFLREDMLENDMFSGYFDEETKEQISTLHNLIRTAAAKESLTAEQMAETLGMKPEEVSGLYYLYFAEDPAFEKETAAMEMSLSDFLTLLMANAPKEQLAELTQMEELISLAASKQPLSVKAMANVLGMGEAEVAGLYSLYFADIPAFQQETAAMKMPLADFLALLKANAPEEQLAELSQMEQLISLAVSDQPLSVKAMAAALGMGEAEVAGLYSLYFADIPAFQQEIAAMKMPLADFLALLKKNAPEEQLAELSQMEQLISLAVSDQQLSVKAMVAALGMSESETAGLYYLYFANDPAFQQEAAAMKMPLADFLTLLKKNAPEEQLAELSQMEQLISLAVSDQPLSVKAMAAALGMSESETAGLYYLYFANDPAFQQEAAAMKMPLADFLALLKSNAPEEQQAQLSQMEQLISLAVSEQPLDAAALSGITGMDAAQAAGILMMHGAESMTLPDFLSAALTLAPENAQLQALNHMVQLAVSGTALDAETLAAVFSMEPAEVTQLFGLTLSAEKTVTFADFTAFLTSDILTNKAYAASFTAEQAAQLTQMHSIVQLAVSGADLDVQTLASVFAIEPAAVMQLFGLTLSAEKTIAFADFTAFLTSDILTNETYAASFTKEQAAQLTQMNAIVQLAVSGAELDAKALAAAFGIEPAAVMQLFGLTLSAEKTAAFADFTAFLTSDILTNETYAASFTEEQAAQLTQMNAIVQLAVSGAELDAKALAAAFGIEPAAVMQLFGLTLSAEKTVAFADFTAFLISDILTNETYAASFTEEQSAQLTQMNAIVQLAAADKKANAEALAAAFGMKPAEVKQLFGLTLSAEKTVTFAAFTGFLVDQVLTDEAYAASFTEEQAAQLTQMNSIVQPAANNTLLNAKALADIFDMDTDMITTVFRLYFGADISGKTMSLKSFVNFILSDSLVNSMMTSDDLSQLKRMQSILDAVMNETAFTAEGLAEFLGDMDAAQAEQLYILKMYEDGAVWTLSPQQFISFAVTDVLENEDFKDQFDAASADDLKLGHTLVEAVVSEKSYTVSEMYTLLSSLTEAVSENELEVMYLYYGGVNDKDQNRKMTIPELFSYLSDELMNDKRFTSYFDAETRADIFSSKIDLNDAIEQMQGDTYSRLVITSDYPDESSETYAYIERLHTLCRENFSEYYLVGNSVMVSEMDETFDKEYLLITLITAISVFFVVLVAFRNPTLPLILTLVVQCGVFFTVAVIGAYSSSIYYLALLIVQSILMGATIDYGIVFCNFYNDSRRTKNVFEALKAAYEGSIHTIMTSGSILVLVLAILGIFVSSAMISEVCVTLSIGVLVAILLILFVLPGLVACCDKLLRRRR